MTAHDAWTRSVIEKKIKRLENRVDMLNEEKMKLLAESHGDGRPAEGDDGSGEDDKTMKQMRKTIIRTPSSWRPPRQKKDRARASRVNATKHSRG